MKWRSTVVLLVVACGLGLYLYFFQRPRPAGTAPGEEKRQLFQLSAEDIDRLHVTHGEVAMTLERELVAAGTGIPAPTTPPWRMTEPIQVRASASVCDEMASDLASLTWDSRLAGAAQDSQKVNERGLAQPRATLTFRARVGLAGARGKEETLEFGDDTPLGDRVYLRRRGGADLYEVRRSFLTSLLKGVDEFRDMTVLPFAVADVEKFSVSRQGERLVAERKDGRWQLAEPFPPGTRGDRERLEEALKKLAAVRVEQFVADSPETVTPEALAGYGLATPLVVVELEAGGKPLALSFGAAVPEHPNWRFVRTAEGPSVYAVKADAAEFLARPFLEFRDRRLTSLTADRVETLTVALAPAQEGGKAQTVEVVRKAAKPSGPRETEPSWRVTKPRDIDADEDEVRELLRDVDTRTVLDFVDFPKPPEAGDLAPYGLDTPRATLTLTAGILAKPAGSEVIAIGVAEAGRLYLRRDEEATVLAVSDEFGRLAVRGYLAYRTKKLTEVKREDVTRIRIERRSGAVELTKEKNDWQLITPMRKRAESAAVDDLLFELAPLHAESIVAEDVTDFVPYGLDSPAYRLEVEVAKQGEKPVTTVVSLGAEAPEKGGRFARLGTEGLVVTLRPQFVDRLDAEFRYRTVLTFDRDKVEELALKGVTSEVVAAKVAGAWQLRQPEGQSLDAAKVNGLLDELASLRVGRWVAYEATDLAPYGLDAPVAAVSVRLGGLEPQSHTLAFGGDAAGDVYARLEEDRGVFLLPRRLLEKVQASVLAQAVGEPTSAEPKPEGEPEGPRPAGTGGHPPPVPGSPEGPAAPQGEGQSAEGGQSL